MDKEKIKTIIIESLGKESYWIVNKKLSSHIGMYPTILLSELVSKDAYHTAMGDRLENKYFYHKADNIETNLYISSDLRRKYTNILQTLGLIDIITKGLPAKHYYSINYDIIADYMSKDIGTQIDRDELTKLIKSKLEKKQENDQAGIQEAEKSNLLEPNNPTKEAEKSNITEPNNPTPIYNNKDNKKESENKVCEKQSIVNNNEGQENKAEPEPAHTQTIEPMEKIEQSPEKEHTHYEDPDIAEIAKDPKTNELLKFFEELNSNTFPKSTELTIVKKTDDEIKQHYSNEIAKIEQEYNLQRDISIPKLSIDSLLTASEDFLGRVGIGFDNNPRRILNLIYKQLPKDFVIKEDSKDVEILWDMIRKYTSSGKDERESIAKRIYQAVEAMLKIYVIKKYGEPYREIIYPDIAKANLALYLNCNPTFKYCLGGFSNDIDGVYTEICRLAEKDAKKKVSQIKIEHNGKIRSLETDRLLEMQSIFTEDQKIGFQERTNNILRRMDVKEDIEDQPLARPIQSNLTEEEKKQLNELFVKQNKTNNDVLQLNFLIKKSKK